MTTEKLRSCPWCGFPIGRIRPKDAIQIFDSIHPPDHSEPKKMWMIECTSCKVITLLGDIDQVSMEQAIVRWNQRQTDD